MKLSTFIMMFLIIAGFMFVFGLMSSEAKTYYPNATINDSAWVGKYDFSEEINSSTAPLIESLEDIQNEETGWFSSVLSGIVAVPKAVIGLAKLFLGSFSHGSSIITGTLFTLGISATLVAIIIIMIIVWGIMKLIAIYQRWNI